MPCPGWAGALICFSRRGTALSCPLIPPPQSALLPRVDITLSASLLSVLLTTLHLSAHLQQTLSTGSNFGGRQMSLSAAIPRAFLATVKQTKDIPKWKSLLDSKNAQMFPRTQLVPLCSLKNSAVLQSPSELIRTTSTSEGTEVIDSCDADWSLSTVDWRITSGKGLLWLCGRRAAKLSAGATAAKRDHPCRQRWQSSGGCLDKCHLNKQADLIEGTNAARMAASPAPMCLWKGHSAWLTEPWPLRLLGSKAP